MNMPKASRVFDLARNHGKTNVSQSSGINAITSESSVNNEIPGVCPKCGRSMSLVVAKTCTRGDLPTYYCEPCCVATPVQE